MKNERVPEFAALTRETSPEKYFSPHTQPPMVGPPTLFVTRVVGPPPHPWDLCASISLTLGLFLGAMAFDPWHRVPSLRTIMAATCGTTFWDVHRCSPHAGPCVHANSLTFSSATFGAPGSYQPQTRNSRSGLRYWFAHALVCRLGLWLALVVVHPRRCRGSKRNLFHYSFLFLLVTAKLVTNTFGAVQRPCGTIWVCNN